MAQPEMSEIEIIVATGQKLPARLSADDVSETYLPDAIFDGEKLVSEDDDD